MYIANTRYQVHTYAVYSCVWRLWVVFLEHGGGALGIFKSPVWTYNQAWTFSLPSSHYFSFLSKRSGRRMPPAERSEKTCLDLAHFGGHARHIVPPLSSSQPVIPDEIIIRWGKEPSRSSLLSLLFVTFFFLFVFFPVFPLFHVIPATRTSTLLLYVFGFPFCINKTLAFHLFSLFVVFFLSFFRFPLRVTREDKPRRQ